MLKKVIRLKTFPFVLISLLGQFSHLGITVANARSPITESLSSIQSKALKGDPHYQGILALFHKFGERGLAIDLQESERWAKMSAEKEGAIGLCVLAALSLEKGEANRGQFLYDEAYLHSNLLALAKGKDPLAMYCLGMIEMDNPPRNFTKAVRHLEASAEKGFATAQATLGMIYFTGIGVKKNSDTAIKWCSRAARVKLPLGMFYLGMAYSIGDSVEQNDDYAIRWIRTAADRELVMAQLTLGMKFATGDGVKKDLQTAVNWLHRASQGGSSEAKLQLRKYENRLERLRNPPATYIPDNRKDPVAGIADRSIQTVDFNSSENLTSMLPNNRNKIGDSDEFAFDAIEAAMSVLIVDKDPEKAKNLLETPALKGNSIASRQLGLILYKEKDFTNAKKWFEKAANRNDPESLRHLGILYFLGQGVQQDYAAADKWLTKAAQAGDLEATRYLRIVKQFY